MNAVGGRARDVSGQALLEAIFSIVLLVVAFTFAVGLFMIERRRVLCEKSLFEATRAAIERPSSDGGGRGGDAGSGGGGGDRRGDVGSGGGGVAATVVDFASVTAPNAPRTRRTEDGVVGTLRCGREDLRVAMKDLLRWPE